MTTITFENHLYTVQPDMALVSEIESELGGIPALVAKLSSSDWSIGELVTLVQICLQAAGRSADYRALGNRMIADGLDAYLAAARAILCTILKL